MMCSRITIVWIECNVQYGISPHDSEKYESSHTLDLHVGIPTAVLVPVPAACTADAVDMYYVAT